MLDIDAELVTRARAGNRRAVEDLLALLRPAVVRYARAHLGPAAGYTAAEDVAQDACAAVYTALPGYRPHPHVPFGAWVWRIVANHVVNAQRRAGRIPVPTAEWDERRNEGDDPGDVVAGRDEGARVRALLGALPERERQVVVLRVAVGMSTGEVGQVLGMRPGTVRVTQTRALAKLRALAGQVMSR